MKRTLVMLVLALSFIAGSVVLIRPFLTHAVGTTTGILTGTIAAQPNPVNLTTEGTVDWVYWFGRGTTIVHEHKANVTQQISNYSVVGTGSVSYANAFTTFRWTDGTPRLNMNGIQQGLFIAGIKNGFQLTVPASTTSQTLKVYVGVMDAQGKFTASLSGNSATSYTDSTLNNLTGTTLGLYTISFAAGSSGQSLTVTFTVLSSSHHVKAKVILQAATLH